MRNLGPIVLSLVCLVVTKPLGAGVNRWSSGGPYSGVRSVLVVDPVNGQTIYALTGAGVFKSTDGGSTFGPTNTGLNAPGTNYVPGAIALAVDPRRPSTLYSSAGDRLFKSDDGGSTWCLLDFVLSWGGVRIWELVPDPNTADMMYAVGDSGLFKTTDAGASWSELLGGTAYSMAVNPLNPSVLLVGSVGFLRSVDGGRNWTQPATGLVGCCYNSVVFDPVSPSNAWTTSNGGAFKSIDGGVSWTASGLPFGARNLRLDPSSPAALFAVTSQPVAFAGYQDAVVRSLDGGATWNPINVGLPTEGGLNVSIYSLALGPGNPATLLVSTAGGLFKSTDRGGHWQALLGTPAGASVSGVATSRSVPGPVYAAASGHVFRSADGGKSWVQSSPISNVNLVAVDPMTPSTVYASTSSGLMKSLDSGVSWSPSGTGLPSNQVWSVLAVSPSDPSTVYVATSGYGLFKSVNAGLSWVQQTGSFSVGTIQSLAVDPVNPAVLYAGSGSFGVYKSSDGGASWKKTSVGLPEQPFITSLAVDPQTPSTIYAADSSYYGLFKSLDGGASWTSINKGIGSTQISGIVLDPVHPSNVYAGTRDAGVFRSLDGGLTWAAMQTGLTSRSVTGLAIDSTGTALHAGTFGGGVFDFQIDGSAGFGQLLPIVLDVNNGSAHYTSDLTLTNASADRVPVTLTYGAALGSKEGSGSVTDELAPGEQRRIPDVLSYLRGKGLAIPAAAAQPSQGGTLLLSYAGSGADPGRVAALARTAAGTGAPQPAGRAGLAYGGPLLIEEAPWLAVYGLRSTASDRSNLAVANVSADPVTFRVTLFSGTGDGRSVVFRSGQVLPSWGWIQFNSPELLEQTGITNGWAVVERTCSAGALTAYGVVNDRLTNDGSFLASVAAGNNARRLTVPALVETPRFRSEVVLTNPTAYDIGLEMSYVESLSPGKGAGGTVALTLEKGRQLIIPEAIDYLRRLGARIGARDEASYAGSLRITAISGPSSGFAAGARTSALSSAPEGGQFGLFTPGIYETKAAQTAAFLFGLAADGDNRSNAAVANTGADADGSITLSLQVHDGDAGGMARGDPIGITLDPGGWKQVDGILRAAGVSNGWVEITRTSGSAPWIAYGVINDGGNPGERTGDGAYIPMTK